MILRNRRYRERGFRIGGIEVRLNTPRRVHFSDPEDADTAETDREVLPVFGIVWSSSEVLTRLLLERDLEGRRILEIGCGMALVSHYLNALGADITAMDVHPMVEELLRENVRLNAAAPIPYVEASWSDESPDLGKFDLIVGSDVLYDPAHARMLPPFLDRHANSCAEVVIVDPDRGQQDGFCDAMFGLGFACERSRPGIPDAEGTPHPGTVYRFTR